VSCLNTDDNQIALATERTTVPTKTALVDRFVAEVPRMKAFTEIVQTARSRTGKLGDKWPTAATHIYTAMQTALTGGAAPEQALQQAQNG
jgi:multiple sugar transport system substrate-binding protein